MPVSEAVASKIAGTVLAQALGGAWKHLTAKDAGKVVAKVYDQWQEGVTQPDAREPQRVQAFELFFEMKETIAELDKLLRDYYQEIDVDQLAKNLRESCEKFGCPLPECDLAVPFRATYFGKSAAVAPWRSRLERLRTGKLTPRYGRARKLLG